MELRALLRQAGTAVADAWTQATCSEKAQYVVIAFLGLLVVVSGAVLVLALIGLGVSAHSKDIIVEVCSQILNGCFTLSALVTQPMRLYMLCRVATNTKPAAVQAWFPALPIAFRDKPGRDASAVPVKTILHVLLVLNFNCLFQYPITAVMWGYNYHVRPAWVIGVFLPLSFGCTIAAGVWQYRLGERVKTARADAIVDNDLAVGMIEGDRL
ncbi:hypothetical protein ACHHYP_07549 [Achlya hypogyna]|uniref:Uncharacterized protein n=1 Tax=Achlya hypogyna TaxID=1202772 RepID=A0A1V9YR31_ACHHY|nr:hypothetical protein ACHHYP_07549 [Achlya hypogyna]